MKKILFFILVSLLTANLFSASVSVETAKQVAKAHFLMVNNNPDLDLKTLDFQLVNNPQINKEFSFYVFEINDGNGYIIVSSNDAIRPILAYSLEGKFNADDMSPAQKFWYEGYNKAINAANEYNVDATDEIARLWNLMMNYQAQQNVSKADYTSPILLEGIKWDQIWPYNSKCPALKSTETGGSKGHTYVGCVATAVCQVMKYWNWPPSGTGSATHSSYSNGGYTNVATSLDFSKQTYNWDVILGNPTVENEDLGKINFHAGFALKMTWGAKASGTWQGYGRPYYGEVMSKHFKYKNTSEYLERYSMTDSQWKQKLIAEIDAKRPVIYSGQPDDGNGGGHAWVCDGYETKVDGNFFHMNWGWGGAGNNYCTLDNLWSQAFVGANVANFNDDNMINIKIEPDPAQGYITGCSGTKTYEYKSGTFESGSPASNYDNNQDCTYIIKSDCANAITINFLKFALASGDFVKIYSDLDETNLLETLSSTNIPSKKIISNTGLMKIRFTTDASATDKGWKIEYSVTTCSDDTPIITATQGVIEDGSKDCLYEKDLNCKWVIAPNFPSGTKHKIYYKFEKFELDPSNVIDRVRIFDSPAMSGNALKSFTKKDPPTLNEIYSIESDYLVVYFKSGEDSNGSEGWVLRYNTDANISVSTNTFDGNINLFPNPAKTNDLTIYIDNQDVSDANFTVTNMLGDIIATKQTLLQNGTNNFQLYDITNQTLANGVYYLNIKTEKSIATAKFIIIE